LAKLDAAGWHDRGGASIFDHSLRAAFDSFELQVCICQPSTGVRVTEKVGPEPLP
jgi:hypothetical protein